MREMHKNWRQWWSSRQQYVAVPLQHSIYTSKETRITTQIKAIGLQEANLWGGEHLSMTGEPPQCSALLFGNRNPSAKSSVAAPAF